MVDRADTADRGKREEVMCLFVKNMDMVSGFLYALVQNWDLVDEAIQETTVYLCNHWNDYKIGTNFCAWIRTVARLRLQEVIWQKQRSEKLLRDDFDDLANTLTYDTWDDKSSSLPHQTQLLNHCLKSLPENHRKIMTMLYQEEQSYEAVSEYLQKPLEIVYMALFRIRKRLKMCMERRLAEESA